MPATKAVDLFGWVDDIERHQGDADRYDQRSAHLQDDRNIPRPAHRRARPSDPDEFKKSLLGEVLQVGIRHRFASSTQATSFSRLHPRQDLRHASAARPPIRGAGSLCGTPSTPTATSFLIGHVIASGDSGARALPVPMRADESPASRTAMLSLAFNYPHDALPQRQAPAGLAGNNRARARSRTSTTSSC